MDELVALVAQKTGLPTETAKMAVDTVIAFLKERLPAPVAAQVDALLSGNAAGLMQGLSGLGGLFGQK